MPLRAICPLAVMRRTESISLQSREVESIAFCEKKGTEGEGQFLEIPEEMLEEMPFK